MLEKIKESEISALNVKSTQGTRLTGTVTENKNAFDKLPELMAQKFNAIIDSLSGTNGVSGADNIGVGTIEGITGTTVQAVLESFKQLLDNTYNQSDVDTKLAEKASQSVVDKSIKTVELDSTTGILTFTRQDGTSYSIDTMLEKIVTNFDYDSSTQSLVFTASDGTSHRVSIAEFITNNEFTESDQIAFSISNGTVSANIKSRSVTDAMLDSAIKASMEMLCDGAKKAAENATASESNTAINAAKAQKNAEVASAYADVARQSEQNASGYVSDVAASAVEARSYAVGGTETRPGEDTDNARYYKNKAESAKLSAEGYLASVENNTKLAIAAAGRATEAVKGIDDKVSAAETSAANARDHAANSATASTTAGESANAALSAESAAETAKSEAEASAREAKSYAVGGTNSRADEDINNAKYYANDARKSVATTQNHVGQVETSASSATASAQLASQKASLASISEVNASKSAEMATAKAVEADASAKIATQKAVEAKSSADSITDGAEVATRKAAEASASAEAASVAQKAAEQAAKEAQGVVEGDFATNAALEGHANNMSIHVSPDEKTSWTNKANAAHTHDNYVEKIVGKALSSNDYTDADKAKVGFALTEHQDLSSYATKNYVETNGGKIDVIKVNGKAQLITDKGVDLSIPTKNSQLENDSMFLTEHQKIDNKAEKTYVDEQDAAKLSEAKSYTEKLVADLINGAPAALDTLKELADAVTVNTELMSVLNEAIGNKVSKETGKGLSTNDYTAEDKNKLDGIATGANNYTHPANHPASMIVQDVTHRFVTDEEKDDWTNKVDAAYVEANGGKIDKIKVNNTEQTITNKEVNLSIPTKVSQLTNDSGFLTTHQSLDTYATKEYVDSLMLVDENTEV